MPAKTTLGDIRAVQLQGRLASGDRPMVVDVREPFEYEDGHIPGAVLLPLGQLPQRLGELDPERETVLVCRSGSRSGMATAWLRRQGYGNVRNMVGGMLTWRGEVESGL